jgi:hypothetical protein
MNTELEIKVQDIAWFVRNAGLTTDQVEALLTLEPEPTDV